MEIETKFNINDKVWKINNRQIQVSIACSFCGGTGRIKGADESDRSCPECYGRQVNHRWEDKGWTICQENPQVTIGQVRCKFTGEWNGSSDLWSNYGAQKEKYEEQYMCHETGIGSGTLHCASRLFATEKEAQAECDRLIAEQAP